MEARYILYRHTGPKGPVGPMRPLGPPNPHGAHGAKGAKPVLEVWRLGIKPRPAGLVITTTSRDLAIHMYTNLKKTGNQDRNGRKKWDP